MVRVVNINIDRLVLEGFAYEDRLQIGKAVEQELSRLLSENNLVKTADLKMMDVGAFNVNGNMSPRMVGAEIGRSVYRGIVKK